MYDVVGWCTAFFSLGCLLLAQGIYWEDARRMRRRWRNYVAGERARLRSADIDHEDL